MRTRPNICCKMSTDLLQFCAFLSVLMSGLMKTVLDNILLSIWFNVVNNSDDDGSYGVCGGGYHCDNSNSCNDND